MAGIAMAAGPCTVLADPVWDPTEIARLSEQTAQLASNLSAVIENLGMFNRLAAEVGTMGPRSSPAAQMVAQLANYSGLQPVGAPTANDAFSVLSNPPKTATDLQQDHLRWAAAYEKTAAEGFAVSQVANRDLPLVKARSLALGVAVGGAEDLRADVQANSAVCLAVLTELGTVQAVLALLLQEQSLARLATIHNVAG